jgi:glycosyltransferase involved in cell wall biosynthesis
LAGGARWDVTVVAPTFYSGAKDLRSLPLEHLAGEPYRLVAVPTYLHSWAPLFFYSSALKALLRKEAWDMVFCWEEPYVIAGGQICRWTPPWVPFVFWTAQNLVKHYPPPFRAVEQFCLRRAAAWVAAGDTTRQARLQAGYGIRPGRVMPLGVALDHFRPDSSSKAACRRQLGWNPHGPPVIGFLGRFVAEKGLGFLMAALDGLDAEWRALFVGGGPMDKDARAWANRHRERVRVVPPVPHADVPQYLNAMDILCAPSRTVPHWREQQGRMVIEAFACGVPVIGSDSGEIPNVIADAGIVCSEDDLTAWRRAIGDLIDSPTLRSEFARKGLERAQTVYCWRVIAEQYLAFFEELLHSRSGPARQN